MLLTKKLLGYLNRVFNKDPQSLLSLRLGYDGDMQWKVADGVLTTTVSGGSGAPLAVDLSTYTVATLVALLGAQPGYSVPYADTSDAQNRSALTLIDGSGTPTASNGDHLNSYTSVLWAWVEAVASELKIAGDQVVQMIRQMVVGTAEGEWLDELGLYYDTQRLTGEADPVFAARIIASVGRPRGNNVALEMAINTVTGGLAASVVDYTTLTSAAAPYSGGSYGLFDVVYSVALDGPDNLETYTSRVVAIVEAFRDAGTHMRSILIRGTLSDVYASDSIAESLAPLVLSLQQLVDTVSLGFAKHDGAYRRDGSLVADGTPGPLITFSQGGETLKLTMIIAGVVQPVELI